MILELAGELKSMEWKIKWKDDLQTSLQKDFDLLKEDCKAYIQDNGMIKTRMRMLEDRLKIVENESEKRNLQDSRNYTTIKRI